MGRTPTPPHRGARGRPTTRSAGPQGRMLLGTPRSPGCSPGPSWPTRTGCGSPRPARRLPGCSADAEPRHLPRALSAVDTRTVVATAAMSDPIPVMPDECCWPQPNRQDDDRHGDGVRPILSAVASDLSYQVDRPRPAHD